MDGEINKASGDGLWVLAFDRGTGERVGFVCRPRGQVIGRKMLFEMDGYHVEVMTGEELDAYIASGGR